MNSTANRLVHFNTALLLLCFCFSVVVNQPTVLAQNQKESSRRQIEIIEKIETAGGRVMQISSADPTREVSFYLAGEKIKDEQLKGLSAVENVIWLNLANTAITNDGLKHISDMKLTKLHLENTGIGDEGLMHLKEMKDLTYLNLYATSVTDKGLKHLAGLSKLKKVYVWQSKVTKAGMKELEKQIPGLKVVGESKLPVFVKKAEEKKPDAKPAANKKLGKRAKALNKREKALNEKEAALNKREEELKKKEQAFENRSKEKKK